MSFVSVFTTCAPATRGLKRAVFDHLSGEVVNSGLACTLTESTEFKVLSTSAGFVVPSWFKLVLARQVVVSCSWPLKHVYRSQFCLLTVQEAEGQWEAALAKQIWLWAARFERSFSFRRGMSFDWRQGCLVSLPWGPVIGRCEAC